MTGVPPTSLMTSLRQDFVEECQALSGVDKQISRLYHLVENTRFNAADGYALARALQLLLQERRRIKERRSVVQSLLDQKPLPILRQIEALGFRVLPPE